MQKRIGLYGGTFDPVHSGHIALAKSFLISGIIDELWILLTPFPPHKLDLSKVDYIHRFYMLQLAFKSFNNAEILSLENELPSPSYTFRTIVHLVKKYPNITFHYCLGGDSLVNFHTWKQPGRILAHSQLLVASRPGSNYDGVASSIMEKVQFVDHQPINVSSTEIKSRIVGNKSIEGLVHPDVESYIRKHKLYLSN